MNRTFKMTLDASSINKAIRQLNNYCDNTLPRKCKEFVSALADVGISTAQENVGATYGDAIIFSKEVNGDTAFLVMSDAYTIIRGSVTKKDVKLFEVSPSYMAEFGSGWLADVPWEVMKGTVGQGTYPNQKHAFNPKGWWWKDFEDEKVHHSYGETPTSPLFFAWIEMENEINQIALKVFGKR